MLCGSDNNFSLKAHWNGRLTSGEQFAPISSIKTRLIVYTYEIYRAYRFKSCPNWFSPFSQGIMLKIYLRQVNAKFLQGTKHPI